MGSTPSSQSSTAHLQLPKKQHVLLLGGTGRTGRKLVERLCDDGRFEVTAVVRSLDKAQLTFGENIDKINVVEGDLTDVAAWSHRLAGVNQIVTAVSCGLSTDVGVLLGYREAPANVPAQVDSKGIAALAEAAKEHGVRKVVAVTTASAGSPWSAAAIFLNAYRFFSVKHKFEGEQALRRSGLDYVILRPFGLGDDVPPPSGKRGIEYTQGKTPGSTRRRIPREDVARLCHEALLLEQPTASRATFECWATDAHAQPMDWAALAPDPPGALPDVNHDLPVLATVGGVTLAGAGTLRGLWRALRFIARRY